MYKMIWHICFIGPRRPARGRALTRQRDWSYRNFFLVGVRELTRQGRICTWFDGDRAMLFAGPDLVGVAVASQEKYGLYVLQSLSMPNVAAAASSAKCLDGEMKLVWRSSSESARAQCVDSGSGASKR